MDLLRLKNRKCKAQAATELAVFGAVLVFLIGSIVRNGLGSGQQQNVQLKAMRLALLQSYKGSVPANNGGVPVVGRSSSTVVYYEDRLSPDVNRYGNTDRSPLVASGSGSLTNLLYYPLDNSTEQNDSRNLPTADFYVNGVHLPLTTAAVVTKTLSPPATYQASYSGSPAAVLPVFPNGLTRQHGWEFNCIPVTGLLHPLDPPNPITNPIVQTIYGCPLFYSISTKLNDYGVLTEDEAYDLNRNDDFSDDPLTIRGSGKLARTDMGWHWKAQQGIIASPNGGSGLTIDPSTGTNNVFDVDGDGQGETIYAYTNDANLIVSTVTVMDGQEGDLDGALESINGRQPGMQQEMSILTQSSGSFFVIKEGKLYNPESGKYARSLSFKDQVELVQRMFQLTKNTKRFCSMGGNPVPSVELPDHTPNPVEVCAGSNNHVATGVVGGVITGGGTAPSGCSAGDNIKKTCLDTDTLMLYIRTRVLDRTGHAWLSDTTGKMP